MKGVVLDDSANSEACRRRDGGVGDPSCDVAIAWTLFKEESRDAFRAALRLDDATWARGRGWALWKALITLAEHIDSNPSEAEIARRVIDEVLADHRKAP